MFIIEDGRDSFYQWDLNRRLIIQDNSITEVHFCNRTDTCSLVVEVYEENGLRYADVPNILLQTDWRINVYAWDSEYTKHSIMFHVNSRTKPADYVYTETEVKTWDALENEIHGAIEALNDAETARVSAEDKRALAEDIRIQNEAVRVAAEIERNEAEAKREETSKNTFYETYTTTGFAIAAPESVTANTNVSVKFISTPAVEGYRSLNPSGSFVESSLERINIPDSIKALPDYGYGAGKKYNNTVDFERGIYSQRCIIVEPDYASDYIGAYFDNLTFSIPLNEFSEWVEAIETIKCSHSELSFFYVEVVQSWNDDKGTVCSEGCLGVRMNGRDVSAYELQEFVDTQRAEGTPVTVCYGIPDYKETDISAIVSDFNLIATPGDTISFDNAIGTIEMTVPRNYVDKKTAVATFANALKGHEFGVAISASDVSPFEHELDVKVSSKNLFKMPNTITPDSNKVEIKDNSIVITNTKNSSWTGIRKTLKELCPSLNVGDTAILTFTSTNTNSAGKYIYLSGENKTWNNGASKTITEASLNSNVVLYCTISEPNETTTISNIQIEKGTVATAYTPHMDVEGTIVTRLGKNFANLAGLPETKKYKAVTDTISGYRIDDDGNIIITSCSTDISSLPYVGTNIKLSELCPEARVGMTMRLRVIDSYSEGASKGNVCIYLDRSATVWAFTETAKAITITQNMLDSNVVFYASYTPNAVRTLSNFQIELGENATEYEPYREPVEAIVDAEGNVEGLMSLAPNMTIFGENGTTIDCTYNRDINKAFEQITQAMVSLGANI